MANTFVKWCRAKLLHGYRHMAVVVPGEGGRSDTETLVRSSEDELLLTPSTTPSTTPTPPLGCGSRLTASTVTTLMNNKNAKTDSGRGTSTSSRRPGKGTYLEEVSCNVSVAAAGESERQEFSFTLYDFDGHGKVTKDDIAGLVRTIYEAVGSSMRLPPSGSRTIKVRLTVSPCAAAAAAAAAARKEGGGGSGVGGGVPPQPCKNPHVAIYGMTKEIGDMVGDGEVPAAAVATTDTPGRGCTNIDQCSPSSSLGRHNHHHHHHHHHRRKGRRRSNSLQRQELLQIIQANMEKNNLYYTPLRRRQSDRHEDSKWRRSRHQGCRCERSYCTPSTAAVIANSPLGPDAKSRLMDPELSPRFCDTGGHSSCWSSPPLPNCRRTTSGGNNNNNNSHSHYHTHNYNHGSSSCRRGHHRSRSHDLSREAPQLFRSPPLDKGFEPLVPSNTPAEEQQQQHNHESPTSPRRGLHAASTQARLYQSTHNNTTTPTTTSNTPTTSTNNNSQHHHHHHRSKSYDGADPGQWPSPRGRHRVSRTQVSPHHLKHRHREAEHARAMAQVVTWLERGSLNDAPTPCAHTHHVHEHIHHHYHHYPTETPPIVI